MDLPLGKIRIRKNGGSAGHNGVESVIAETGSADFARIRIGIGRSDEGEQAGHVLSEFPPEEEELFVKMLATATEAVNFALCRDIETVMNKYNGQEFVNNMSEPIEKDCKHNSNKNITEV